MSGRPLLLGHRGSRNHGGVAENSLAAFEMAMRDGCDGFEFDVRRAGCGTAVVCHDARVKGTMVAKATRKQLGEMADLAEVLKGFGSRAFLDIELKVPGLETMVLAALRKRSGLRNVMLSSFLPEVLMELRARTALVPLGVICRHPSQLVQWRTLPVEYVIVHHTLITRRLVRIIHEAERRILAWTVNRKKDMRRLAGWGVDGIISDNTKLLAATLTHEEVAA